MFDGFEHYCRTVGIPVNMIRFAWVPDIHDRLQSIFNFRSVCQTVPYASVIDHDHWGLVSRHSSARAQESWSRVIIYYEFKPQQSVSRLTTWEETGHLPHNLMYSR
jgi:hypothetical protein